jgi:hypothetical protein
MQLVRRKSRGFQSIILKKDYDNGDGNKKQRKLAIERWKK